MSKKTSQEPVFGAYHRLLLEKLGTVRAALGMKFDTLARLGRVAEEDQAQLSHDEFVSLRLNSLEYVQLKLVEEALDRIQSGDYGICLGCDEPIPAKRLQALPWAQYCVGCQERTAEAGAKEPGDRMPRLGLASD